MLNLIKTRLNFFELHSDFIGEIDHIWFKLRLVHAAIVHFRQTLKKGGTDVMLKGEGELTAAPQAPRL